jgi:hypothetical protein
VIVAVLEESMKYRVALLMLLSVPVGSLYAGCIDMVEIGDPGFVVIEKCGEPVRREREELKRTSTVEVVRGSDAGQQRPQQPLLIERWYYDTSLNAATVIHLEDGGVSKKGRLIRQE